MNGPEFPRRKHHGVHRSAAEVIRDLLAPWAVVRAAADDAADGRVQCTYARDLGANRHKFRLRRNDPDCIQNCTAENAPKTLTTRIGIAQRIVPT